MMIRSLSEVTPFLERSHPEEGIPSSRQLADLRQKKYKNTDNCLEYKESVDHPIDKDR